MNPVSKIVSALKGLSLPKTSSGNVEPRCAPMATLSPVQFRLVVGGGGDETPRGGWLA